MTKEENDGSKVKEHKENESESMKRRIEQKRRSFFFSWIRLNLCKLSLRIEGRLAVATCESVSLVHGSSAETVGASCVFL